MLCFHAEVAADSGPLSRTSEAAGDGSPGHLGVGIYSNRSTFHGGGPNVRGHGSDFYRSPAAAIEAPPEKLAYVAAFDPAGEQRDAMTVIDCDPGSDSFGEVVGWTELPTAGNELHHFGWNACSSALCHEGHDGALERRYLIVPGLRSSRTYVLDTGPDPRQPQLVRTIEPEELAEKAGYSRPHTVHCGPGGIFMSNLGAADGATVRAEWR